jgi:hypothetical protein
MPNPYVPATRTQRESFTEAMTAVNRDLAALAKRKTELILDYLEAHCPLIKGDIVHLRGGGRGPAYGYYLVQNFDVSMTRSARVDNAPCKPACWVALGFICSKDGRPLSQTMQFIVDEDGWSPDMLYRKSDTNLEIERP